jgi:hypothetical protein
MFHAPVSQQTTKPSELSRVLYSKSVSLVARTGELDPAVVHMSENPPCPSGVGSPESSGELALDSVSSDCLHTSQLRLHAMHDVA